MARPSVAAAVALLSIAFFACASVRAASAADIWAANATGVAKDSFYNNETVYAAAAANITNESRSVRLYVTADINSWANGTALADVSGGYETATTNASGHLPTTAVWAKPHVGSYDLVADVDADGLYNTAVDLIDGLAAAGFAAVQNPQPSLTFSAGAYNPAARNWPLGNSSHATMTQFNVTVAGAEEVKMYSFALIASGTGNDFTDVKVAYLVSDANANGAYDAGDGVLGYGVYTRDDGVINFEISGGYAIDAGASRALLMAYDMKAGASGSTYILDLTVVTANGTATNEPATVSGLPLKSAVMTLGETATTTTTSAPSTTTTTPSMDECQTDADCPMESCSNLQESDYSCKLNPTTGVRVCAATIESVQCCGDGDCGEGQACVTYACAPKGFSPVWLGGNADYALVIGATAAVIGGAAAVFLFIKNRKQTPWKGGGSYERDRLWSSLKDKWKKRDNSGRDE